MVLTDESAALECTLRYKPARFPGTHERVGTPFGDVEQPEEVRLRIAMAETGHVTILR